MSWLIKSRAYMKLERAPVNKNKAKTKALFQEKVSLHRQTTTIINNNNKHGEQLINHIDARLDVDRYPCRKIWQSAFFYSLLLYREMLSATDIIYVRTIIKKIYILCLQGDSLKNKVYAFYNALGRFCLYWTSFI